MLRVTPSSSSKAVPGGRASLFGLKLPVGAHAYPPGGLQLSPVAWWAAGHGAVPRPMCWGMLKQRNPTGNPFPLDPPLSRGFGDFGHSPTSTASLAPQGPKGLTEAMKKANEESKNHWARRPQEGPGATSCWDRHPEGTAPPETAGEGWGSPHSASPLPAPPAGCTSHKTSIAAPAPRAAVMGTAPRCSRPPSLP